MWKKKIDRTSHTQLQNYKLTFYYTTITTSRYILILEQKDSEIIAQRINLLEMNEKNNNQENMIMIII